MLNIIGQVAPLLVGVVTIPFIVKGMGMECFGILSLAWTILAYFSVFDLGLSRSTTKFVAEFIGKGEVENLHALVWTSLSLHFLLGTFGAVIFAVITPFLVKSVFNIPFHLIEEAKITFFFFAGSMPFVICIAALRGVLEAKQRFDLVNIMRFSFNSSIFLVPAAAVMLDLNLPSIAALLLLVNLCVTLVYLVLCIHVFPGLKNTFALDRGLISTILSFSSWIAIFNVVSSTMLSVDRILIGTLLTMTAVSYYTIPYEMVSRLAVLPASLTAVLFPVFSAFSQAYKDDLSFLYANAVKYLSLIMGIAISLIILSAPIILQIWVGNDFSQNSKLVLQILAIGLFANSLAWIPCCLLQGAGRPDIPSKFRLIEFPLYIGLSWIFINKWGIVGAAISWTIWLVVDSLLLFLGAWKIVPDTMSALIRKRTMYIIPVLMIGSVVLAFFGS